MAPTLRRRLNCHYCGKRSNQKPKDGRQFKCDHCLAVNFLDENGDIADVPPEELEFSQDRRPVDLFKATDIFCSTCLKNQRLYTSNLSEYLPDPDDESYDEIESSLPEYRKKLEERYPQCCAQCEPRVRAKMQQATYAARSDHMRRMLEKSRARRVSSRLGWRSLVVSLAGIAYFLSLFVQLGWHGLGSRSVGYAASVEIAECFSSPVPRQCVEMTGHYVGWALAAAFVSIWWNPKWQHKLGDEERLIGLSTYYRLQLTVLALRFSAWVALPEAVLRVQPMLHSLSLIAIVILSGMAMWTVRIDTTPLVNWDFEQPELVTKTQYVPPPTRYESTFPIASLAPTRPPSFQQWRPPTPPGSEDQMDWAPSYNFNQPKHLRYRDIGPSPFHSTLPNLPGEAKAIGLPPGHFDKRDRLPQNQAAVGVMKEPTFFPPDVDTGLENIFGHVFSLKEPTSPVRENVQQNQINNVSEQHITAPASGQAALVSAALLILSLVLWSLSDVLAVAFPLIRLYIIGFAIIIPFCRAATRSVDVITSAIALEAALLLWIAFQTPTPIYEKLGAGILSILALQEIVAYTKTEQVNVSPSPVRVSTSNLPPPLPAREASVESLASEDSINTTSTAPAWKTPRKIQGRRLLGMDSLMSDR